jgi:hypothetical protein
VHVKEVPKARGDGRDKARFGEGSLPRSTIN